MCSLIHLQQSSSAFCTTVIKWGAQSRGRWNSCLKTKIWTKVVAEVGQKYLWFTQTGWHEVFMVLTAGALGFSESLQCHVVIMTRASFSFHLLLVWLLQFETLLKLFIVVHFSDSYHYSIEVIFVSHKIKAVWSWRVNLNTCGQDGSC